MLQHSVRGISRNQNDKKELKPPSAVEQVPADCPGLCALSLMRLYHGGEGNPPSKTCAHGPEGQGPFVFSGSMTV